MLIRAEKSALLVIDVQERLLPAIEGGEQVMQNIAWLTRIATRLGVPVMASEQYPSGLGPTVPELRAALPLQTIPEKTHFSCVASGCLDVFDARTRQQVVVTGIETHVCVLQTTLELKAEGNEVFVVADCVSSRRPYDRELALARMRDNGVQIVTSEMVVFEWLRQADTPLFKEISREFLR